MVRAQSGTVIPALDAIVELTIYLSGRDGYPIAANRRRIFPPTFSPPQDESACDGSTRRTPICFVNIVRLTTRADKADKKNRSTRDTSSNAPGTLVGTPLSVAIAWLWLLIGELLSRSGKMLRKIDCVMIRVEDVDVSAAYYAKVFGLRPKWSAEGSVGLAFPEADAEIVLHRETTIPSSVEVYYLVDDVMMSLLP
jgi:hypothetical protein